MTTQVCCAVNLLRADSTVCGRRSTKIAEARGECAIADLMTHSLRASPPSKIEPIMFIFGTCCVDSTAL